MPLAANLIPLLAQGVGQIGQQQQQNKANLQNIAYSQFQYAQSKRDNIKFWRMQNEYNDPKNQIARMKAAGINPALALGGGQATGGTASPIQSGQQARVEFRPPTESNYGTQMAQNFYKMQIDKQTVNNLGKQNELLDAEKTLKNIQAYKTLFEGHRTKFDYEFESSLKDTSLEFRRQSLEKLKADIGLTDAQTIHTLTKQEIDVAQNASNLKEAAQRILLMKAQTAKTWTERRNAHEILNHLKWESELNKVNVKPGDNFFLRILGQVTDVEKRVGEIQSYTKDLVKKMHYTNSPGYKIYKQFKK